jgi:membrane-associated phospholipid phosphatase
VFFLWHKGWAWRVPAALFSALVSFSAVYLTHHYILDVLAGLTAALAAFLVVEAVFARRTAQAPIAVPLTTSRGDTRA